MGLSPAERDQLIQRYAAGPALLRAALDRVPPDLHQWRPAPGEFSAHEVVVHCADSETLSHGRIRFVLAEREPVIQGYDEPRWAVELDYHNHPEDLALAAVEAVRANTTPLLRSLPDAAWEKTGRHTESGPYSAEDWLRIYAAHLEDHARQIDAILAARSGAAV